MLIMSSNVWFRSSLIFLILYFSVSRSSSIWQTIKNNSIWRTIKNNSSKNGSGNLPTGKSSQWLQWSRSPPDQSWRWASGCSSQPARLGIRSSSTCIWGEQRCRKYLRQLWSSWPWSPQLEDLLLQPLLPLHRLLLTHLQGLQIYKWWDFMSILSSFSLETPSAGWS